MQFVQWKGNNNFSKINLQYNTFKYDVKRYTKYGNSPLESKSDSAVPATKLD